MYSMLQYVCIEVYYGKNQKINCVFVFATMSTSRDF